MPKTPDNPMPVAFKLTSSNANEAVFENPKHDSPQKIPYQCNTNGSVTAVVSGTMNGQPRQIEFKYAKAATQQ